MGNVGRVVEMWSRLSVREGSTERERESDRAWGRIVRATERNSIARSGGVEFRDR